MSAVYQLLGYPGTGKYTIAKEIVRILTEERDEEAVLLDNHATANIVWSMVPIGRRFDTDVLDQLSALRQAVLTAAEVLASPETSFVFTNYVTASQPGTSLERTRELARRRGQRMVAVVLVCDPEEILRRVTAPGRAERMKLVDATVARRRMAEGLFVPDWPECTELDINGLTATEAAGAILAI